MEKIIYCFSGTGNSLRTARIIAEQMGGARIIAMKDGTEPVSAEDADIIGFVCPVYEWDVPETVRDYIEGLRINPDAYIFMAATYILIHGRCFETVDGLLRQKGARLDYGRGLRCVGSQCVAYEPFPPKKLMLPHMERGAVKIGREAAAGKRRKYPRMSPVTRRRYAKAMVPFLNVQHEYDKGFYVDGKCVGCRTCQKICPRGNITFEDNKPVWNHACIGCNACVAYCPTKAIKFKTPPAYAALNNIIVWRLGLPDGRTRYHHPYITAADLMKDEETI